MNRTWNQIVGSKGRSGRILAGVSIVLLGWCAHHVSAQQQSRAGAVRVVLQPGAVARQSGNQVVRTTAQKDMAVFFRDVLETGVGGRMRARLDDGSILALGSQSRLTVTEHNTATEQTGLQLQFGKVRSQVVDKTRPDARFEVRTNTAVAGVLGTDFVVDALSAISTLVLCIEGQVYVRNADNNVAGTVTLNAGEITTVGQGLVPTPPRPATPEEIQNALEGSGGAVPEAVADIGTGFVTAGDDLLLSGVDSFATGIITTYQWVITRASDTVTVYNQSQSAPDLLLDTTTLEPGNYEGTLTITTSMNETATTSFGFVVLPSEISNTNPELVIQQLQLAYETLQPNEFMKLFDPLKYSGYAALQQSVEASFRNLSQARVFVRRASGQIFEQGRVAIYQVDFEIQFSLKSEPDRLFVTREQATLRMESGSGWLITDVPQGQLGGGGLLAIPGSSNPNEVNTVPVDGSSGAPVVVPEGDGVVVLAGGSNTFVIQNTSTLPVTITFTPPPGITITGDGVVGTTFTIPAGESLTIVFAAELSQPAGTVNVSTVIDNGNSTLPGPTIPVTVARLSLSFPAGGGSSGDPLPLLLGFNTNAQVQVDSTVATGHTVTLGATGGQAAALFAPNPVEIAPGSASGLTTITLTPTANAAPGLDQIAVTGQAGATPVEGTLFINRIAPFTLTRTSPENLVIFAGQSADVTFDVVFNAPFTGPAVIQAPVVDGLTFTPPSVTLNSSGTASFTAAAGDAAVAPTNLTFGGTAGAFGTSQGTIVSVIPPPVITSFLPASGLVGASVTIIGANFTGATAVTFGGTGASFTVNSSAQITATVPNGATTGPIRVTTPAGTGVSAGDFTVLHPPEISSFQPASGAAGTSVTITGANFSGATEVAFNGASATFTVNSPTQITATVPSGATTGPISVTTPGGADTSSTDFTVVLPPEITSFSPSSGLVGSTVTITGLNFLGATSVTFGGASASFSVNSATQITATVPSGASTGPIAVTTPGGTAASASDFTVRRPPTITSFSPASGLVGASVTISGSNFTGTTSVEFNGVAATFTVNSASRITATVPSAATTGPISVTNSDGTATSSTNFTVIPSFSLCVSEGNDPTCLSSIDVNASIPALVRVKVLPGAGFTQDVAISFLSGGVMSLYTGCSLTGTGTIPSPYTSSVDLCLTAGTPVAPIIGTPVTFTGTPAVGPPLNSIVSFNVGVPELTVTPSTFTIPSAIISAASVPGIQVVNIALASSSSSNPFDLPLTVYITGVGSFISGSGPVLAPLPTFDVNSTSPDPVTYTLDSPDCGPDTSGQVLSPGGAVNCTIENFTFVPFPSLDNLIVFVTFGPGGGGSVPLRGAGQSQHISSGATTQGGDSAASDSNPGLVIAPDSVQFSPLFPKPGDRVSIQARVDNQTDADAEGVQVSLLLNGQAAATLTVSVAAKSSQAVEFVWEAEYEPRLSIAISLNAGNGAAAQSVPVRSLFVEPELASTLNQGRSALEIANGECGGFRFLLGQQTFCGGSSDLELSPVITGDGQVQVQAFSLSGGIVDLGPQAITGQLTVPDAGYAPRGVLEAGRLYAVESQGKYGLLYVSRIQSEIDPRLARLTRGESMRLESLDDMLSDRLNELLDQSRITVVIEWAYLENGSRRFSYGFSGPERGPRPGLIRQPRVPPTPQLR